MLTPNLEFHTPVHLLETPAGSTHSSTRGLKPTERLKRQAEFHYSDKTRPDSPVPTLQGPCGRSQKWRGTMRFLPQLDDICTVTFSLDLSHDCLLTVSVRFCIFGNNTTEVMFRPQCILLGLLVSRCPIPGNFNLVHWISSL